jgi:hypothetical protein
MKMHSKSTEQEMNVKKEGNRNATFASLFVIAAGSGVPLGVALHNLPAGIAVGTFFGLAVAIALQVARIRGETHNAGESGNPGWIFAVAAAGGLAVLVGAILFYELLVQ